MPGVNGEAKIEASGEVRDADGNLLNQQSDESAEADEKNGDRT